MIDLLISSADYYCKFGRGDKQGEWAAACVLPLTADNYEAAKNIRFGQPQIIINGHIESLLKIAAVAPDSDLKHLRELYHQVEAHIRTLQALGVESESHGKLLIPLLMAIISRFIDKEEWDLDEPF